MDDAHAENGREGQQPAARRRYGDGSLMRRCRIGADIWAAKRTELKAAGRWCSRRGGMGARRRRAAVRAGARKVDRTEGTREQAQLGKCVGRATGKDAATHVQGSAADARSLNSRLLAARCNLVPSQILCGSTPRALFNDGCPETERPSSSLATAAESAVQTVQVVERWGCVCVDTVVRRKLGSKSKRAGDTAEYAEHHGRHGRSEQHSHAGEHNDKQHNAVRGNMESSTLAEQNWLRRFGGKMWREKAMYNMDASDKEADATVD